MYGAEIASLARELRDAAHSPTRIEIIAHHLLLVAMQVRWLEEQMVPPHLRGHGPPPTEERRLSL